MTLSISIPFSASVIRWFAICYTLMLASACTMAEQIQRKVDETANKQYSQVYLNIDLGNSADTDTLTNAMVRQLERRGLQTSPPEMTGSTSTHYQTDAALLKINEIDRNMVTVRYLRTYPRPALTQMRGRKYSNKPVITLHVTLIDAETGRAVYQADYVIEGPWYAESTSVVAAFAEKLTKQLKREEFIAAKD